MITHKEFYIWLEGYLHGKLENKNIDIAPIVEKMGYVKDDEFDVISFKERWKNTNTLGSVEIKNKEQLND